VRVYVPDAADVVVLTDRVELLPAVTDVGLSDAVTPLGAPDTASETVPALPDVTAVAMVLALPEPAATVRLVGDALMVKSFEIVPPTAMVGLVPLNPVLTVPIAVMVWFPVDRRITPVKV